MRADDNGRWPRRRVAVVVQRYGDGILGGAEAHARLLVQALRAHHDVEVLTSCARDASTWALHFAPGRDEVDGVPVLRFAHGPRNAQGRARVPLLHKLRFTVRRAFDALGLARVARPSGDDVDDGHEYLRRQGPFCPDLLPELRAAAGRWDAVFFFTALYWPTAEGLPACSAPTLLIPTLHDEKPMVLPCFRGVFAGADRVLYNAAGEQRLARRFYGADAPVGELVGAAVQVGVPTAGDIDRARQQHALGGRYVVYVGRIEKGKGCAELVAAWLALGARRGDAVLVLVGDGSQRTPEHPALRRTGFVDAATRDALTAGAVASIVPSHFESLSLALLEALALGVPVLVNGATDVLAGHVQASGAGEVYRSARELRAGLLRALSRPAAERAALGRVGQRYVAEHYSRRVVEQRWLQVLEDVCAPSPG